MASTVQILMTLQQSTAIFKTPISSLKAGFNQIQAFSSLFEQPLPNIEQFTQFRVICTQIRAYFTQFRATSAQKHPELKLHLEGGGILVNLGVVDAHGALHAGRADLQHPGRRVQALSQPRHALYCLCVV